MTTYFTSTTAGSANATWEIESGTLAANVPGTPTIQLGALSGGGTLSNASSGSTATFLVGGNDAVTEFDGAVTNGSGTVALTVTGSGSLTLTGQNSYSGTTTVDGGTVQVGSGGASGVLGGGNVVDNGTLIFNRSNDITVSNAISGTGSVVQQGTGSLYLTGDNNYGGATSRTIINNGLFVVTSSASWGWATAVC